MNITKGYLGPVVLVYLLVIVTLMVGGCTEVRDGIPDNYDHDPNFESDNRKDNNDMEQDRAFLNDSVPPLDLQVPENLETVTLGMG